MKGGHPSAGHDPMPSVKLLFINHSSRMTESAIEVLEISTLTLHIFDDLKQTK